MKKLSQLLLITMLMFGCTDLNDVVEDGIGRKAVEEGGAAIEDPEAALEGIYSQLNGLTDQANYYSLTTHTSDELIPPTRGTDWSDFGVWRQLHAHQWDASHSYVLGAWNQLNQGVFRATQVVDASGASAEVIAQAKFLRAFFMFYVMDFYGQVPFRASDAGIDDIPEVFSRTEALNFILEDLNSARPDLPSLSSGADAGVASQEAVDFLLAKLHLNKAVYTTDSSENATGGPYDFAAEDMDVVIERVDNLINNGYLELTENYWDNFHWENTARSSELIFVIDNTPGSPAGNTQNRYRMTLHYNNTPSSWNGFATIADFYDTFSDEGDVRKESDIPVMTDGTGLKAGFLEGQQFGPDGAELEDRGGNPLVFTKDVSLFYSNERQGIRVIKYLVNPDDVDSPGTDYIFFRFADALLMKAEAHLRKGETAQALAIVNQIRENRGASPIGSLDETAMLNERGYELYWEGWRRNDQIRFNDFLNEWNEKPASDPFRVLFPIPQRALDTNPNLVQNSGY